MPVLVHCALLAVLRTCTSCVVFPFAVVLAVLGAIDSLLTSLVADSLTSDFHDSDKELRGACALTRALTECSVRDVFSQRY
jgi:MFS superfamily sulfate permease-like transporter